jgi:uncharacterized protein
MLPHSRSLLAPAVTACRRDPRPRPKRIRHAMKKPFYDRFSRWILIAAALLFPVLLYGAQKASQTNRNDVKDWLPSNFQETSDFQWFQSSFENVTNVLVTWEGCTLDDPRLAEFARVLMRPDATGSADSRPLFTKVITGPEVLAQITNPPVNVPRDQALARLKGLFVGNDLKQSCAIVSLSRAGQDDLHRTLAVLYAAAEEATGLPRRQIHMGGPPVDNVAIDDEGQKTLRVLIVISGLVGLCLSWTCMRSFKLTALVFCAGVYSAALSLALVYYTGGKMDAVVYSMPPVVFTAALSGAIHIINYYRNVVLETGRDAGAAGRALQRAWIPCLLSAGTTAIGLGSLYMSHLVPIKTFGMYAGVGVIAMLGLLYLCVPAALHLWPPKFPDTMGDNPSTRRGASIVHRAGDWFAHKVVDHYGFVYVAFAVVALSCFWGISRIQTSVSIRNLFSPDAEIIQNYGWLQKELGGLVPMEVVVRFDQRTCPLNFLERLELIERVQQRISAFDRVNSVMSAWTFMPSTSETGDIPKAGRMFSALERIAIRNRERTRRRIFNSQLEQQRGEYQLQDYLAEVDDEELWRVSIRLSAIGNIDYGDFVDDIKTEVEPALRNESGQKIAGVSAVYTGLVPLVYKAQNSLLDDLKESLGTAFLIMAVLMSVVYRSPPAGFLVMLPNVWPMALIFGLLGYTGIIVDIGTMMTASVAMGVSVDDAAHFTTWFRFGIAKGLSHRDAAIFAYRNASLAMAQSSIIVGFGLLVFALSSFVPTQRFGVLMFVLLAFGLFSDLVLMPAILAGPMGKFFTKGVARPGKPPGVVPVRRTGDASVASASKR